MHGLQKISVRCGLLPKRYWIVHSGPTQLDLAFSTTGEVYGTCTLSIGGRLVTVKTIDPGCVGNFGAFKQVWLIDSSRHFSPILIHIGFLQRLFTNVVMWKQVQHLNVVNFLGLSLYPPFFSLAYPQMPNGSLSEYLCGHPDVDRLSLVSECFKHGWHVFE